VGAFHDRIPATATGGALAAQVWSPGQRPDAPCLRRHRRDNRPRKRQTLTVSQVLTDRPGDLAEDGGGDGCGAAECV
jgi:hypothetical protein